MNREQAKALLPIIKAFSEGKTIQWLTGSGEWYDVVGKDTIDFEYLADRKTNYRIKPESKYRPFRNADECWNEMKKHQPFGWVESSRTGAKYEIQCLKRGGGGKIYSYDDIFFSNFEEFFENYKFADGTPFGIKED